MAPKSKHDYEALTDEYEQRLADGESSKEIQADFESRVTIVDKNEVRINFATFLNRRRNILRERAKHAATPQEPTMSDDVVEVLENQMDLNATETPTVMTADTPNGDPVSVPTAPANLPSGIRESTEPLDFHPLARLFPLILGDEFAALKRDIQANGQHESIVICDGLILDGRNRYLACQELGIPYRYEEYTGPDPVAYVISLNLMRRHMDSSQRSMVAAKLANMGVGRPSDNSANLQNISQEEGAELMHVSVRSVGDAEKVRTEADPAVTELVEEGKLAVSTAAKLADEPPEVQQEIADEVRQGTTKPRDVGKRLSSQRSNGGSGKARKPKTPATEPAVPHRKRVQDGLFAVLSMVRDDEAWGMLAELIDQLEHYAEQYGDPNLQQRMEQALSPLGHLIDEHRLRMPDENEDPPDEETAEVCAYCSEADTSLGALEPCTTCGELVHELCQGNHEAQEQGDE